MHPSSCLPGFSRGAHNVMDSTFYCQETLHRFFCPRQQASQGILCFPGREGDCGAPVPTKRCHLEEPFEYPLAAPLSRLVKAEEPHPVCLPLRSSPMAAAASSLAPMEALLQPSKTDSIAGSWSKVGVSTPLQPQPQDLEAKLPDVASPASSRAMLSPLICYWYDKSVI